VREWGSERERESESETNIQGDREYV
jgi:hypothetical protein